MTQRDRHTPDAGPSAPARAAGLSAPSSPALSAAARTGCSLWEEFFQSAAPPHQHALLTLAAQQGILYAQQIAPTANGHAATPRRTLLPALLNGQAKDLEAVAPPLLEVHDAALDLAQREAVARAVQTPDICLLQGTPGSGKSRLIAEIILQAVRRAERVLFVAPATPALDRVLEHLAGQPALCPVRCVADGEQPDALPACMLRLTVSERVRSFQEYTLPAARNDADLARQRWEASQRLKATFEDLDTVLATQRQLGAQLHALSERRAEVVALIEAALPSPLPDDSISPLQAQLLAIQQRRDEAAAHVEARRTVLRTDQEKRQVECDIVLKELLPLTPLDEARQHQRWWTGGWWRSLGEKNLRERVARLRERQQALERENAAAQQESTALHVEFLRIQRDCQTEQERLRTQEISRQQAVLDTQIAALIVEQCQLAERWRSLCAGLDPDAPSEMTPAALQIARERFAERLRREEQQQQCAEAWARGVESALATLPQRVVSCANVVVATTTGLAHDPHFGDSVGGQFDLLILDEAEQVTESEFVNVARRAKRWVLVGQPTVDVDGATAFARRGHSAKPLRPAVLRPGFFQRLWNTLHADPRKLPYSWVRREDRLSCCLRAVPPDHLQWMEREYVADRPEIELGIVAPPRSPSYLAEVVFPAGMTIHEAKEYIFRELGELSIQAFGHSLRWCEDAERILLQLHTVFDPEAAPVRLEPGVCELVGVLPHGHAHAGATPYYSCGLSFQREAGWTLERAAHWVEQHLKTRDLGRTAFLATPYRMHARLAQVLDDLLFAEVNPLDCPRYAGLSHVAAGTGFSPVEFVAVPGLHPEVESSRDGTLDVPWGGGAVAVAVRPRTVKGGAGFEIDLADPRRLDSMPGELRALLPVQGIVNLLEARAVVQTLEQLVGDPALRHASLSRSAAPCTQRGNKELCDLAGCTPLGHCPVIGVMAVYPAQALLLSLLIQRSPVVSASGVRVEVGTPPQFRQRECAVALVSLTRSHAHRAVCYGEDAQLGQQALTRASERVILFGDPGTLLRRSQWSGPLDHLEEAEAHQERDFATRLVRYLHGHGAHPNGFRLREGSSA